jgi:lipopolysaccharide transport system ATP-binding protein
VSDPKHSSAIIELNNLSKIYQTFSSPQQRLLNLLSNNRKYQPQEVRALDDVSLQLERGSRLGIVGVNGSGKSTLLKVLCGVLTPTAGTVRVEGRISALLELGAGFNPELSGRQNIRQFCMLHGMGREQIEESLPAIIAFSELRETIDHPVKTYSSGMAVRLGFACAVYVEPEILIVDEALSVGDAYFQNKCLHKIKSMLDLGTTFIYVTHAADSIRSLCQQAIWMEKGRIRLSGTSSVVGGAYQSDVFQRMVSAGIKGTTSTQPAAEPSQRPDDQVRRQAFAERVAPLRAGSGEARIVDIRLLDEQGQETDSLAFENPCTVRIYYQVEQPLSGNYSVGLGITSQTGSQLIHFNSATQGVYVNGQPGGPIQVVDFSFASPLCPGEYGLMAGIGSFTENPLQKGQLLLDQVVDHCAGGARFAIHVDADSAEKNLWGVLYTPCVISTFNLD